MILNNRAVVVDRRSLPDAIMRKGQPLTAEQLQVARVKKLAKDMEQAVIEGNRDAYYRMQAEWDELRKTVDVYSLAAQDTKIDKIGAAFDELYGVALGG